MQSLLVGRRGSWAEGAEPRMADIRAPGASSAENPSDSWDPSDLRCLGSYTQRLQISLVLDVLGTPCTFYGYFVCNTYGCLDLEGIWSITDTSPESFSREVRTSCCGFRSLVEQPVQIDSVSNCMGQGGVQCTALCGYYPHDVLLSIKDCKLCDRCCSCWLLQDLPSLWRFVRLLIKGAYHVRKSSKLQHAMGSEAS